MDFAACQEQLRQNGDLIRQLVADITEAQAKLKPSPGDWSILEVLNHLYDEEREDFRQRLDYILHRPGEPWPPTDPQGWVTSRQYNARDLSSSLQNFLDERQKSLAWLASLDHPNLDQTETHPVMGDFQAGDMLGSWVVHDILHLRQLIELKHFLLETLVRPYDTRYAGEW
ncbi:MAG: DinB family protein [Ardenticatenaceae bacterium]|nr:DinB family protein [Ardenticatenaceae bacterium]MCB8946666.1 DinB family protein [Ardenticatenaceae bacterium]